MIKITLGKKLFLFTSGMVIGLLLVTFLVLERRQSRHWEEHLRTQSLSFARFATPELLKTFRGSFSPGEEAVLPEVYELLAFNRDLIRFSLISPSGRSLYRSPTFSEFPAEPLAELEERDLSEALMQGDVSAFMRVLPGGARVLDLVAPAFGPTGEHVLSARYLISLDSVDSRVQEMRHQFLQIAFVAIGGSLVLVAFAARRVVRPLKELTAGARAVARGEMQTRIFLRRGDEIGTLAGAFNDMAASLALSQAQLKDKNQELLKANDELRRMQQQMVRAERLAAIGQLAAGISHEIDNPVGVILGYAELLLEDLDPEDPRRGDVLAIIEECRRCRRITGGLLGFARSDPPRREPVELQALVTETLNSLRPQKLFKDMDLRWHPTSAPVHISGDADQLRQVLINLLINAAQALGGRGVIRADVAREGERAVIQVADSGPGIPEEMHERVFDPFFTTKGRGEGTGLGLSVCRKLVEGHDGLLTLGRAPEGGALFRLEFPLQQQEKCFDIKRAHSLG